MKTLLNIIASGIWFIAAFIATSIAIVPIGLFAPEHYMIQAHAALSLLGLFAAGIIVAAIHSIIERMKP